MDQSSATLSAAQRAFLDEVRYGVVATHNDDGSIQQTVVWFLLEGEELRFSISDTSIKARNLRRDPRIALTVEAGARYLTLSGHATVEPVDVDLRRRLAMRYLGAERAEEWLGKQPEKPRASVRVRLLRAYGQGVR